jgi:hypothetical protein
VENEEMKNETDKIWIAPVVGEVMTVMTREK